MFITTSHPKTRTRRETLAWTLYLVQKLYNSSWPKWTPKSTLPGYKLSTPFSPLKHKCNPILTFQLVNGPFFLINLQPLFVFSFSSESTMTSRSCMVYPCHKNSAIFEWFSSYFRLARTNQTKASFKRFRIHLFVISTTRKDTTHTHQCHPSYCISFPKLDTPVV